jgi:hypothetical protein
METGEIWCTRDSTNTCRVPEEKEGIRSTAAYSSQIRHPDQNDFIVSNKSFAIRNDFEIDNLLHVGKKLCMADVCLTRDQLFSLLKTIGNVHRTPTLDHHDRPDDFPFTYSELRRTCERQGKTICERDSICTMEGRPKGFDLPMDMKNHPHWIAVADRENEWISFRGSNPCQLFSAQHKTTPTWGHSKAKRSFHRGVKCCDVKVKSKPVSKK